MVKRRKKTSVFLDVLEKKKIKFWLLCPVDIFLGLYISASLFGIFTGLDFRFETSLARIASVKGRLRDCASKAVYISESLRWQLLFALWAQLYFYAARYHETMQDTRANMGAHLKWDIPMFLGIAATKDGRLGLRLMIAKRHRFFDIFRSSKRARSHIADK